MKKREVIAGERFGRIDNNGDYCKENCRWETRAQQARNYRRNVMITHNGETKCLSDWADQLGMKRGTLQRRIYSGWSHYEALTKPVKTATPI